jgi:hypothetical protein
MTTHAPHADGTFTFADWRETPVAGEEGGFRLAHAVVTNTFTGAIAADATRCVYAIGYAPDGTGTFTGYESVTGEVGGRAGTFVLREWGTFDAAQTVHCSFEVVPGAGTGDLAALRGTGRFTAAHGVAEVPYSFSWSFTETAGAGEAAEPAGAAGA